MTLKIMTVVGARPQFIKAAVVSHEFAKRDGVTEEIVHTGQHFDENMSRVFFDEMSIPKPAVNLGISGGTHAEMTARMLEALEAQMIEMKPDAVLLYGDTNSTLAGALAAAKLFIPIVHVESGTRTFSKTNPEEINRICTDHMSTKCLACTKISMDNLMNEGLGDRSALVGDPMYDAFLEYSKKAKAPFLESIIDGKSLDLPASYYYITCHREENTQNSKTLIDILDALEELDSAAIYPVHPRNRATVVKIIEKKNYSNTLFVQPVGYLESLYLTKHAKQIITDSGGLQREAFFAGVKCTTLLDFECWPETMVSNRNILAKPTRESILAAMSAPQSIDENYLPFGKGDAARLIADEVSFTPTK